MKDALCWVARPMPGARSRVDVGSEIGMLEISNLRRGSKRVLGFQKLPKLLLPCRAGYLKNRLGEQIPYQLPQWSLSVVPELGELFRRVLTWSVPNYTILIGWQMKRQGITSTRERGREVGYGKYNL